MRQLEVDLIRVNLTGNARVAEVAFPRVLSGPSVTRKQVSRDMEKAHADSQNDGAGQ